MQPTHSTTLHTPARSPTTTTTTTAVLAVTPAAAQALNMHTTSTQNHGSCCQQCLHVCPDRSLQATSKQAVMHRALYCSTAASSPMCCSAAEPVCCCLSPLLLLPLLLPQLPVAPLIRLQVLPWWTWCSQACCAVMCAAVPVATPQPPTTLSGTSAWTCMCRDHHAFLLWSHTTGAHQQERQQQQQHSQPAKEQQQQQPASSRPPRCHLLSLLQQSGWVSVPLWVCAQRVTWACVSQHPRCWYWA